MWLLRFWNIKHCYTKYADYSTKLSGKYINMCIKTVHEKKQMLQLLNVRLILHLTETTNTLADGYNLRLI